MDFSDALDALVAKVAAVSGVAFATSDQVSSVQIPDDKFPAVVFYEGPQRENHRATSQRDKTVTLAMRVMYRLNDGYTENQARDLCDLIDDAINQDPQLKNGGGTANCISCLAQGGDPPLSWGEQGVTSFRDFRVELRYRRDN